MADEPRYPGEIRIPITLSLPWSGKLTPGGQPWPVDARGRPWPDHNGEPEFPIDQLPVGFAPGTHEVYKMLAIVEARQGRRAAPAAGRPRPSTMVTVAAEGMEIEAMPLVELAPFLASLAIGVTVLVIIGAATYYIVNSLASQRWARQQAGVSPDPQPGLVPPPLPPWTPPETPTLEHLKQSPEDVGPKSTVRLHPPEGFSIAKPLPAMPPSVADVTLGPLVMEQQSRNAVLQGDERTNTQRARNAARRVDPEVTGALPEREWRAHHLIPMEAVRARNKVLQAAGRAGWKTDEDANIAALPTSPAAQDTLRRAGVRRPVDDSGHGKWNNDAKQRLKTIEEGLDRDFGDGDSPAKDQASRRAVEQLSRELRQKALGLDKVIEIDRSSGPGDV